MDRFYAYATGAVIIGLVAARVLRRDFDPFAPVWLFLTGYFQVYVIQALTNNVWALEARGVDLVTAANARALWAIIWFLLVYYSGLGRAIAGALPRAPRSWSAGWVAGLAPLLILWGLASALFVVRAMRGGRGEVGPADGSHLLYQFPTLQLVGGVLLIVTGRQPEKPRPALTAAGLCVTLGYTLIWMFFGRRSHSLFGVLTTLCAVYLPRLRRPSLGVLSGAAFVGCLVVALAITWRYHKNSGKEGGVGQFASFVTQFDPASILVSLNLKQRPGTEYLATREATSHETEEYGGFLLMLDTVPMKSPFDYGASYNRLWSTYIPRIIWPEKPIYGRQEWVSAWIAGSEFRRDETFTGPAIGILGAAQLNGGAVGTLIVLGVVALVIRAGYDYFRLHADCPWAQAWWAMTYYNAWLMTVNDDPAVWFYYVYGHTILPPLAMLWAANRFGPAAS